LRGRTPATRRRVEPGVTAGQNRKRTAAIILAAALIVPVFLGATRLVGWGDDASTTGGPQDAQALRDAVAVLQDGGDLTYTAVYLTGSGTAITAVQESPRRAYRSTAAFYAVSPSETVLCRTPSGERPACNRGAGRDGIPLTDARGLTDVLATDFIAPELVTAYLSRLAARVPGKVNRFDRAVAGLPTRCVEIMKTVVACATADGVLAHFESPDGRLTLTGYQTTVAGAAFDPPAGAAITDLDG
jgi:hypothetical protein